MDMENEKDAKKAVDAEELVLLGYFFPIFHVSKILYEIENFTKKANILLEEENISKLEHVFKERSSKEKIRKWAKTIRRETA